MARHFRIRELPETARFRNGMRWVEGTFLLEEGLNLELGLGMTWSIQSVHETHEQAEDHARYLVDRDAESERERKRRNYLASLPDLPATHLFL